MKTHKSFPLFLVFVILFFFLVFPIKCIARNHWKTKIFVNETIYWLKRTIKCLTNFEDLSWVDGGKKRKSGSIVQWQSIFISTGSKFSFILLVNNIRKICGKANFPSLFKEKSPKLTFKYLFLYEDKLTYFHQVSHN